jgi:hypothetical protein
MKKELSSHAAAAKAIRQKIKAMGLKCSVTSNSFSMGNSVDGTVYDQPPEVMKELKKLEDLHSYSRYRPEEDYHSDDGWRDDVPQAKYVTISNNISPEVNQKALDFMRERYAGGDELPEKYEDNYNTQLAGEFTTSMIHRLIGGSLDDLSTEFWQALRPEAPEPPPEPPPTPATPTSTNAGGFTIEEHTHTKKGFQMFICIINERVGRAEYLRLLAAARDLKGWYSRKWGTTPAGFAFKDQSAALEFTGATEPQPVATGGQFSLFDVGSKPAPPAAPAAPRIKDISGKLRTLAEGLQRQIDDKTGDRQTNTPKRLAQARHSQLEGERLQRTQQALRGLADHHEAGTVPEVLAKIKSKKAVYDLMGTEKEPVANGYHTYHVCTGKPNNLTPEARALWELISGKTEEQKKAEDLKRRIDGLQFSNIPGYFPTPAAIVEKMIELADLEPGQALLEPEIGSAAIAKAINGHAGRKVGIEYNYTLSAIAQDSLPEEWEIQQADFLECTPEQLGTFDRIIMNPPFDRGLDIKHIKHALTFLNEQGVLVGLCAGGPKQTAELQPLAEHWEELPQGSFKEAGTGVNVSLMRITA